MDVVLLTPLVIHSDERVLSKLTYRDGVFDDVLDVAQDPRYAFTEDLVDMHSVPAWCASQTHNPGLSDHERLEQHDRAVWQRAHLQDDLAPSEKRPITHRLDASCAECAGALHDASVGPLSCGP